VLFQNQISYYSRIYANFSMEDSLELSAMLGTSFTIGRLVSVPLSVRFNPKTMIVLDALGLTASLMLMYGQTSPTALWAGTIVFGLSVASIFPSVLNLAKQSLGASAKAVTIVMQAGSAGGIVSPLLLINTTGTQGLIKVIGAMVITANIAFCSLLFMHTRREIYQHKDV